MIYTESEKDSLDRFMRRFSPLNEFARSLRGEEKSATSVSNEADPFAGIDFDNLPEELKDQIIKAKESVATLQQGSKTLAEEKAKSDKLAKDHQARADRNYELLRKHNLTDDGSNKGTGNADEVAVNEIAKEIMQLGLGLTEPQALAQAKIQYLVAQRSQKSTLDIVQKGMNPTFAAVGDMYANKLLTEAQLPKNDPNEIFKIEEVAKSVNDSMALLVGRGETITPDTVINLRDMAYGRFILNLKPEEREKFMEKKEKSFSSGGSNFGSGNHSVAMLQQNRGQGGKPRASNSETQAAVDATVASMVKGFNLKDGGKKK